MISKLTKLSGFLLIVSTLLITNDLANADEWGAKKEVFPEGLVVTKVSATPATIELAHRFDYRQLLITGQLETGEQVDLTRMAKLSAQPSHVSVSSNRKITVTSTGAEVLKFEVAGHQVEIPVTVKSDAASQVSYVRDVSPAMSKMGCNQGTCHGSKDGQNGFKLSLRGYDFLYDHRALTDDIGSRRFNRAAPDRSLMLLKASGTAPHVGGAITKPGEAYYEIMRSWISGGCDLDLDAPRVAKIELSPSNPVLPRAGMNQQMTVLATYTDGSVRDVTSESFIESGDIEMINADKNGLLTVLRRGEAPVLARYEGAYTATTITIMGDRSGFQWKDLPSNNYIDKLVYEKLNKVKVIPSGLCDDSEFIRRVYLDITGLPPTADEVRKFTKDGRDAKVKRDELVDQLVGNREYVEHWTNKWADLLQVNRKFLGEEGAVAFRDWIKDSVATNKPYNKFAYEVLTAGGSTIDNPAAAYWKILRDPDAAMENTTHLFLAVRFNCNKCHDHPFEKWTQDQYYNLTAYFAQVARKEDPHFRGKKVGGTAVERPVPLVEIVYDSGSGETKHERTGEYVKPSFPYDHKDFESNFTRREQLAEWITSSGNRYFATSFVNRLWGYLLGKGLIEPIDDIRAGNPPTNPALLAKMTEDFVASDFDVQHMLRTICKSRVYQHSVQTNEWNVDDTVNYSHAMPRRLPAEVLYDAIHRAAGSQTKIPGVPVGFRAAELPDVGIKIPFLDDFGRPPRQSSCECERSSGIVLGPIMKLINGPTVAKAVADPSGDLSKLANSNKSDDAVVEEMFLRFLSRMPTDQELKLGIESLAAAKADYQVLDGLVKEHEKTLLAKREKWLANIRRTTSWTQLRPDEISATSGADMKLAEDNSVLVSGKLDNTNYIVRAGSKLKRITGVKLEVLPDESLPKKGPGRAENGNFVLNEFVLEIPDNAAIFHKQKLVNASANYNQSGWDVKGAVDDQVKSGWAISDKFGKPHEATFELEKPIEQEWGTRLRITLKHEFDDKKHSIGKFRISLTDSPKPLGKKNVPDEIYNLAVKDKRSGAEEAKLADYFRQQDKEWKQLVAQRDSIKVEGNERILGMQDLAWALINNPAFLFNR